jgi:hypothetical protein
LGKSGLGKLGRVADYKSAIQQNTILRYTFGQGALRLRATCSSATPGSGALLSGLALFSFFCL